MFTNLMFHDESQKAIISEPNLQFSRVQSLLPTPSRFIAVLPVWRTLVESGPAVFECKELENGGVILQTRSMHSWSTGYKQAELDEAQERYDLQFPPDLIELFLEKQPTLGYNWRIEDSRIRRMLSWPLMKLLSGVEDGFWWPSWGPRPEIQNARAELVTAALAAAPRLIPILGHRFIPESPSRAGNPVFSMYGFDTVYYGADLKEYFINEFEGKHGIGSPRRIPFWSDLVERFDEAYAYYAGTRS